MLSGIIGLLYGLQIGFWLVVGALVQLFVRGIMLFLKTFLKTPYYIVTARSELFYRLARGYIGWKVNSTTRDDQEVEQRKIFFFHYQ